jgi:HlyD family secretion protein
MTRRKLLIGAAIVVVLAALAYGNSAWRRTPATSVTVEKITRHELEAIVSASGKVEPARQVNISAETMGRVVSLWVTEGQEVKVGQPLLEIDPRNLETAVQNREASLETARSTLEQTRTQVENSRVALQQARDTLRRTEGMWEAGLVSREQLERDQNAVKMRETDLLVSEQSVRTQEQRIRQEEANLASARHDLTKVRMVSPINGIVTRRNIELGETAVVGTMNNAGTVLLTIADMGVIETEIEVDETDIPYIQVGQSARITIDALPNQTFNGRVTEVGNSPIQATGAAATGRATNFMVVVTIDGEVPNVRPGFTCTAEITTATRSQALGVPIQAMTVRELIVDASGNIVPTPPPASGSAPVTQELQPGQSRKEFEGVFVVRNGRAAFVPVRTGIAGERYFEVLEGLQENDEVITGPFASVRSLRDGDPVTVATVPAGTTRP